MDCLIILPFKAIVVHEVNRIVPLDLLRESMNPVYDLGSLIPLALQSLMGPIGSGLRSVNLITKHWH